MTATTRTVLEQIRLDRGRLTPRIVVDESRAKDAALHHRFEWDDDIAGEKYREVQAGQLIRSVKVSVITEPDRPPTHIRAFLPVHGDEDDPGADYMPADEVARSPMLVAIQLETMRREWLRLRRKYQDHEAFWALVAADVEQVAS